MWKFVEFEVPDFLQVKRGQFGWEFKKDLCFEDQQCWFVWTTLIAYATITQWDTNELSPDHPLKLYSSEGNAWLSKCIITSNIHIILWLKLKSAAVVQLTKTNTWYKKRPGRRMITWWPTCKLTWDVPLLYAVILTPIALYLPSGFAWPLAMSYRASLIAFTATFQVLCILWSDVHSNSLNTM